MAGSPALDLHPRRLWEALRKRPLTAIFLALLAVSLLFLAAPGLDLAVSGLFYDPVSGFPERSPVLVAIRELGLTVEWAFGAALVLPLIVKLVAPESRLLVRPRVSLFGLATLALGPGLLVNAMLKDHWGRARPREIFQFGGDVSFSPVWWISSACDRNCSFVSGEAASAFWLVALAFVAPPAWRRATAIATLAFAACVSFARVAAGGHFISDVAIAWLLMLFIMVAMRDAVLAGLPQTFDPAVEGSFARAGRRIRQLLTASGEPPPGS